jgi:hypothetical protein
MHFEDHFDDHRLSPLTLIIFRWWNLRSFSPAGIMYIYNGAVQFSCWKGRLLRLEWPAHGGLLLCLRAINLMDSSCSDSWKLLQLTRSCN